MRVRKKFQEKQRNINEEKMENNNAQTAKYNG